MRAAIYARLRRWTKNEISFSNCRATLRLWSAATGVQIGPVRKHDDRVNRAVSSKDETRILTWSLDGTARRLSFAVARAKMSAHRRQNADERYAHELDQQQRIGAALPYLNRLENDDACQ